MTNNDHPARKVVILNGPPGSGKNTGALAICGYVSQHATWMQPRHLKFAEPLKRATHALVDTALPWDAFDRPESGKLKNVPSGDFMGLSPREFYIALSEKFMKPEFGDDFLGYIMRKRMVRAKGCMLFVMSDGQLAEVANVIDYVGARNVLIIELEAPGCTFEGDSRSYIGKDLQSRHDKLVVRRIQNDLEDRELFRIFCIGAAKKFLQIEERV